jgi:hypothetical protein
MPGGRIASVRCGVERAAVVERCPRHPGAQRAVEREPDGNRAKGRSVGRQGRKRDDTDADIAALLGLPRCEEMIGGLTSRDTQESRRRDDAMPESDVLGALMASLIEGQYFEALATLNEDPFETWKDGVLDALTGIQGVRSNPLREIAIKAMDNVPRATDFPAKVKLLNGSLRTATRLTKKG